MTDITSKDDELLDNLCLLLGTEPYDFETAEEAKKLIKQYGTQERHEEIVAANRVGIATAKQPGSGWEALATALSGHLDGRYEELTDELLGQLSTRKDKQEVL